MNAVWPLFALLLCGATVTRAEPIGQPVNLAEFGDVKLAVA